ncbi:YaaC family protein [Bacillus shivajii]|uniref:YaaC family protein n=1 Tax=Bacillus shivajii TaxID=1983719 RepID=UPI001CF9574A|nr:YaaC family protein [Bacillus shivajii]UCZ53264.1 YaaC family protein [Bacillus shivajii]
MSGKYTFTTIFLSADYVKTYLHRIYEKQQLDSSKELSYKNGYSFVYYIKMGDSFFSQGLQAPLSIKPVLFFYGLSHWLKALLLTVDPFYPSTTQVLAHGVSTRKRKKQDYSFLKDEIKVQKDGFYRYLSEKVFHVKQLTGEKFKMYHLLMAIPELLDTFKTFEKTTPLIKLEGAPPFLTATKKDFKRVKEPPHRFAQMVNQKTEHDWKCYEEEGMINIDLQKTKQIESSPLAYAMEGNYYLPVLPTLYRNMPELLIHYLILYNLSMICRYETEWWGELLYSFSSNDLPFIDSFLEVGSIKIPFLLQKMFDLELN